MTNTTLADALRAVRAREKISQETAARSIGVGLRTYQGWEAGEHLPGVSSMGGVAEFLGLSLSRAFDLVTR